MNNIIDSYRKFKIYYLKNMANLLYLIKDVEAEEILDRYLNNYFNAKFYNIYETLENGEVFSYGALKEEYRGLEIELLQTYSDHSREVKELRRIAYFVCYLDDIYPTEEDVLQTVEEELAKDKFIETHLGNKKAEFIKELSMMSTKENKILDAEINESFELIGHEQDKLVIVDLKYDIKQLYGYRKTLVNQVFKDEKIYVKKVINILNKLTYKLLKDKCLGIRDNLKYVILLDSSIIVEGDFAPEIKEIINNQLIINKVSLALPDEVLLGREKIFKNSIKLSCHRDMTYIKDIDKKLTAVLALPIEYFIVTNYKPKDEASINNYSDIDYRIVIYEEDD